MALMLSGINCICYYSANTMATKKLCPIDKSSRVNVS